MIAQKGFTRYPAFVVDSVRRLALLRSVLRKKGLSALLVTARPNILYLTGLDATEALLLVTTRSATLFVDSRYHEAAAATNVHSVDVERLPAALERIDECAFEEDHVTIRRLRRWKQLFKHTTFVRSSGLPEELRRKKDADELRLMVRAKRITQEMLRRVPAVLRASISEREVAWKLRLWAEELGADDLAFPPIVAFASNSSRPHHRAATRKLRRGDVVQIDVGVRFHGYCSDMSRVFSCGPMQEDVLRIVKAVEETLALSAASAKAKTPVATLDQLAREALRKRGIADAHIFGHALGHGVGLDVHEGPVLSSRSKAALLSSEVIAIEPAVYIPGRFGVRIEDTVVVE